jgi:hypothetical protein
MSAGGEEKVAKPKAAEGEGSGGEARSVGVTESKAGEVTARPSTHQLIIDRFEGDQTVVEVDGERFVELPRWLFPAEAREDDLLILTTRTTPDGAITHEIRIDAAATALARAEARKLVDRLRRKDPGGDLVL